MVIKKSVGARVRRRIPARRRRVGMRRTRKMGLVRYATTPPQHQYSKLVWEGTYGFTSTGSTALQNVRLQPNNLFDLSVDIPFSQQSLFRDQMFTLYEIARCMAFTITITIAATSQVHPTEFCLYPTPFPVVTDTDINIAKQRKNSRYLMINSSNIRYMKLYSSVDRYYGRVKGYIMTDDVAIQYSGSDNLADSSRVSYVLSMRDVLGTTPVGNSMAVINIKLTQYVRFEQPRLIGAS